MFSLEFIQGITESLRAVRNKTWDAETAITTGDIQGMQRAIAEMVSQALNCQCVMVAKLVYEVNKKETKEE